MIKDLKVLPLKVRLDDRGYLFEIIHDYEMPKFGQVYVVGSPVRGTVRAFHKHEKLWDYFCIVKGSAKFVFVDANTKDIKTETVILSEKTPKMITVPPDVYHGWMSLEDGTVMVSTASDVYNKENPDETRVAPDYFNDLFGDVWAIKMK